MRCTGCYHPTVPAELRAGARPYQIRTLVSIDLTSSKSFLPYVDADWRCMSAEITSGGNSFTYAVRRKRLHCDVQRISYNDIYYRVFNNPLCLIFLTEDQRHEYSTERPKTGDQPPERFTYHQFNCRPAENG